MTSDLPALRRRIESRARLGKRIINLESDCFFEIGSGNLAGHVDLFAESSQFTGGVFHFSAWPNPGFRPGSSFPEIEIDCAESDESASRESFDSTLLKRCSGEPRLAGVENLRQACEWQWQLPKTLAHRRRILRRRVAGMSLGLRFSGNRRHSQKTAQSKTRSTAKNADLAKREKRWE